MTEFLEVFKQFFVLAIVAMVAENAVFSRGLTTPRQLILGEERKGLLYYAAAVTYMTTLSGVVASALGPVLRQWPFQLRAVAVLCCIGLVYLLTSLVLERQQPAWYTILKAPLTLAAFNSTVFGTLLVTSRSGQGFFGTLGYSLGTGAGLTLAMLLIFVGQSNLEISDVPKAFRGLPITLVYIGILSLAIYGLVGHQLPV